MIVDNSILPINFNQLFKMDSTPVIASNDEGNADINTGTANSGLSNNQSHEITSHQSDAARDERIQKRRERMGVKGNVGTNDQRGETLTNNENSKKGFGVKQKVESIGLIERKKVENIYRLNKIHNYLLLFQLYIY